MEGAVAVLIGGGGVIWNRLALVIDCLVSVQIEGYYRMARISDCWIAQHE